LRGNMLNCTIPGAFAAISIATHGEFHPSSTQSASHVFLCLKSGYLSFVDDQKSRSSWSAMYSPHPGNKWYHKNRERCSHLLHQHIALTYFLQPTTTTPPVQRTWKEILPRLDQGRIATTNREKKDWHQQEVWLQWHELWHVWCYLTLSDLWSQHYEGILKDSCHCFSVWPPGTAEKLPVKWWTMIT
jgi:hypothetical protein